MKSWDNSPDSQRWERVVPSGSGDGKFHIYKKGKEVTVNGYSYTINDKSKLKSLINDLILALKKF